MNLDLFLIQKVFEVFAFSQNYFYLAKLDDENPSMIRNPNPIKIRDDNESPNTTRNPSLARNQDVARNPNPIWIQDVERNPNPIWIQHVIRNCYPTWIEDPLTYNGCPITRDRAKKMKEALHMLIQAIWA